MNTRFAVVQRSLDRPEVERLKRAFRVVKCLTQADARILANDAFGILVKNLPAADAMALQGALKSEGIETAVVSDRDLPSLPAIKFVREVECRPECLTVHDPIGRKIPIAWEQLMVIAAGNIGQFERAPTQPTALDSGPLGSPGRLFELRADELVRHWLSPGDPTPGPESGIERRVSRGLAEIILARAVMRFQIVADQCRFRYLGERVTEDNGANFAALVRDLMTFAPRALVNRGAYAVRENPAAVFEYPGRHAFEEELIWILWRAQEAASPAA